jgi:hypothetical protein
MTQTKARAYDDRSFLTRIYQSLESDLQEIIIAPPGGRSDRHGPRQPPKSCTSPRSCNGERRRAFAEAS